MARSVDRTRLTPVELTAPFYLVALLMLRLGRSGRLALGGPLAGRCLRRGPLLRALLRGRRRRRLGLRRLLGRLPRLGLRPAPCVAGRRSATGALAVGLDARFER